MTKNSLSKRTRNEIAVLDLAVQVADACLRGGPVDEVYRELLRKLKNIIAFDAATVFMSSAADGKLHEVASLGNTVEVLDFLKMEHGDGLSGWTADNRRPIVLADRTGHHDFEPGRDYASFMSVPVTLRKKVVAVINFGSDTPGTYTTKDADRAAAVASQMALAFEKLELQRHQTELKKQLDDMKAQMSSWQERTAASADPDKLRDFVAKINHDINNALAILVGNVQCILMEKSVVDQKTVSRLKRMERALMQINSSNHKILELIPQREKSGSQDTDLHQRERTTGQDA